MTSYPRGAAPGSHPALTIARAAAGELCALLADSLPARWVAVVQPVRRGQVVVLASAPAPAPPLAAVPLPEPLHRVLENGRTVVVPTPCAVASRLGFSCPDDATVVAAPLRIAKVPSVIIAALADTSTADVDRLAPLIAVGQRLLDRSIEVAAASDALERERHRSRALSATERTSRLVFHKLLDGGDATTVLAQLSELVHKPVILYTPDFIVTAWSSPPGYDSTAPPRVPVDVVNQAWFTKAVRSLTPDQPCVIVDPNPAGGLTCRHLLGRLAVHGRATGYLDIVAIGQDIQPAETTLAELAALALSMQQLSEMLQLENEGRDQEDFLSELLRGGNVDRLARRAPLFGVDLARRHVLVRFEYRAAEATGTSVSGAVRRARLIDELAKELAVGPPIAVGVPGADVLLLRVPRTESVSEGLSVIGAGVTSVVHRLRGFVEVRRVIVSEPCADLDDYPPTHRDLFAFSQLADERGWEDGVHLLSELGVVRLLIANSAAPDSTRFTTRLLGALDAYDADNGADLTATLRAFVESDGRIHLTAQRLGVHDNTVRYRLGRIEHVLERGVDSLDDLVAFRVAFQIRDLYGQRGPIREPAEPDLRLVHG